MRRRVHLLLSLFRPDAYHPSDHDPVGEVVPSDEHASYYTLAQGLEGQALRAALHSIIRGHVRHSYSEVWKILEEAGEDPAKSEQRDRLLHRPLDPQRRPRPGGNTPNTWNREYPWAKS